jgi:hypothetical protein
MDAYIIHQKILQCWQQLVNKSDATSIKKNWKEVPIYADGKIVINVKIEDDKIILETK